MMAAKRFLTFCLNPMNTCNTSLVCVLRIAMETFDVHGHSKRKIKMAMSDVDVSSSLDHDEEPLAELTDEELYNLVQETL